MLDLSSLLTRKAALTINIMPAVSENPSPSPSSSSTRARTKAPFYARIFLLVVLTLSITLILLQVESIVTSSTGLNKLKELTNAAEQSEARANLTTNGSSRTVESNKGTVMGRNSRRALHTQNTKELEQNLRISHSSQAHRRALKRVLRTRIADPSSDIGTRTQIRQRDHDEHQDVPGDEDAQLLSVSVGDDQGQSVLISAGCAASLTEWILWITHLRTMAITFVSFQAWMLLVSLASWWFESTPHLSAVLVSHSLASIYAIVQLVLTRRSHNQFHREIVNGTCSTAPPLIPGFWGMAIKSELAIAVIQPVGALAIAGLAWKVAQIVRWRSFKKLGASRQAARAHFVSLSFEVLLATSTFFLVAFQSIWVHEIMVRDWSPATRKDSPAILSEAYKIVLIVATTLLVIVVGLGQWGVRRKSKIMIIVSLAGQVFYLGHSVFLATQSIFMRTQASYSFLAFLAVTSSVSIIASLILGTIHLLRMDTTKGDQVEIVQSSFPISPTPTKTWLIFDKFSSTSTPTKVINLAPQPHLTCTAPDQLRSSFSSTSYFGSDEDHQSHLNDDFEEDLFRPPTPRVFKGFETMSTLCITEEEEEEYDDESPQMVEVKKIRPELRVDISKSHPVTFEADVVIDIDSDTGSEVTLESRKSMVNRSRPVPRAI